MADMVCEKNEPGRRIIGADRIVSHFSDEGTPMMDDASLIAHFLMEGYITIVTLQATFRICFGISCKRDALPGDPCMQLFNLAASVLLTLPPIGLSVKAVSLAIQKATIMDPRVIWSLHLAAEIRKRKLHLRTNTWRDFTWVYL